jgi:hypothetical protein
MDGIMKEMLKGKKTYMVSAGMVVNGMLAGFGQLENGGIDFMDCNWQLMNWAMILNGLGLSTLRAGLAGFIPMLKEKK